MRTTAAVRHHSCGACAAYAKASQIIHVFYKIAKGLDCRLRAFHLRASSASAGSSSSSDMMRLKASSQASSVSAYSQARASSSIRLNLPLKQSGHTAAIRWYASQKKFADGKSATASAGPMMQSEKTTLTLPTLACGAISNALSTRNL
eukprot:scaffold4833_cov164-Pinguiococcus_pyrenoidosus.AAC.3